MKKIFLFISIFLIGIVSFGQAPKGAGLFWDELSMVEQTIKGHPCSVYYGYNILNRYHFHLNGNVYVLAYRANDDWKPEIRYIGSRVERDLLLYRFVGNDSWKVNDKGHKIPVNLPWDGVWVVASDVIRTDYEQSISRRVSEYSILLKKGYYEGYDKVEIDGNIVTLTLVVEEGESYTREYQAYRYTYKIKLLENGMFAKIE